jgi:hypothetical protein
MLMPHPTMLRRLVEEYETPMAHQGDGEDTSGRRCLLRRCAAAPLRRCAP